VLATCPTSAKTHNQIGQLWMERGEPLKALRYHEKALALDPDFCDANYTLALAHASLGNWTTSKNLLRASLPCVFTSSSAFQNLQKVWQHQLSLPGGREDGELLEEIGDTLEFVVEEADRQEEGKRTALDAQANSCHAPTTRTTRGSDKLQCPSYRNRIASVFRPVLHHCCSWLWHDGGSGEGDSAGSGLKAPSPVMIDDDGDDGDDDAAAAAEDAADSSHIYLKEPPPLQVSAAEHFQGAAVVHINAARHTKALGLFSRALRLYIGDWEAEGGGGHKNSKNRQFPESKGSCECRYWLARAHLEILAAGVVGETTAAPANKAAAQTALRDHLLRAEGHAGVAMDQRKCPATWAASREFPAYLAAAKERLLSTPGAGALR